MLGGPLACDLEHGHGTGRRDVQRVDGTVQRDPREHIAALTRERSEASSLGPDHERYRPVSEREVEHRLGPTLVKTDRPDSESLQLLKSSWHTGNDGDADMLDRAGCDLGDRRCHMRAPMARQHEPGHTGAFGTP